MSNELLVKAAEEEGVKVAFLKGAATYDTTGRVREATYGDVWVTPSGKVLSRTELGEVFLLIYYEEN